MLIMVLLVLCLGGISLDLWRVFSERRQLAGIVDAAAVAGASGLDERAYRTAELVRLDPALAEQRAWAAIDARADTAGMVDVAFDVAAQPGSVSVAGEGTVEFTLLRLVALWGAADAEPSVRLSVVATSGPQGVEP